MTNKSRKVLFYSLTIIFFVLGTGLIFYSNGWRLDPETLSISRLGGLFVEVATPGTTIKIGKDTLRPGSSFLHSGIFVPNLFPKPHAIEVIKDGHQSWKKSLTVKPSLVTKTYPIILLPKEFFQEPVLKNISDFWLGQQSLAWKNQFNQLFISNQPALGSQVLEWSSDDNAVITINQSEKTFFVIDALQNNTALNLTLALKNLLPEKLLNVKFYPKNNKKLILATDKGLYILNLNKLELQQLHNEPVDRVFTYKKGVFWASNKQLYSWNRDFPKHDLLLEILTEENFAEINLNLQTSPDNKKLAIATNQPDGKIKIYFLEDAKSLGKKWGDLAILAFNFTDFSLKYSWDKISSHLFIQHGSNLYFSEIDDRSALNLQFVDNKTKKYQYDSGNNILYLLSASTLYKLDLK